MGRVQTPTLAILAEREREIDCYVLVPGYQVAAEIQSPGAKATVRSDTFEMRDVADELAGYIDGATVQITDVCDTTDEVQAPLPFDLTELQVEASRRFSYSAARTLEIAQRLYELGHLSYPRTDSRFLTWDLLKQLPGVLDIVAEAVPDVRSAVSVIGPQLASGDGNRPCFNKAAVRDHHAIIPTNKAPEALSPPQQKIYELVARRTVAAFADPALIRRVVLSARASGSDYILHATAEAELVAGWHAIEPPRLRVDMADVASLERLAAARSATVAESKVTEVYPRRPTPHTDATLLRAMLRASRPDRLEWRGIGTPATRAAIIERLIEKKLAERHNHKFLVITDRGRALIEALGDNPLTSGVLTAQWEKRLNELEEGAPPEDFDADLRQFTTEETTVLLSTDFSAMKSDECLGNCPRCGGVVRVRRNNFSCDAQRDGSCDFVIWRWRETPGSVGPTRSSASSRTARTSQAVLHRCFSHKRPHAPASSCHITPGTPDSSPPEPSTKSFWRSCRPNNR